MTSCAIHVSSASRALGLLAVPHTSGSAAVSGRRTAPPSPVERLWNETASDHQSCHTCEKYTDGPEDPEAVKPSMFRLQTEEHS